LKAFLLAAGLGTRLYSVSKNIPKCLMLIDGKPMLYHWFKLFADHGITDVLINLHYLYEQVISGIENYKLKDFGINIVLFYETVLLGTAGTISENKSWVDKEDNFLIAYADNLTKVDITRIVEQHILNRCTTTLWLYRTEVPEKCGIATLDASGKITEFVEKPEHPRSEYASAALYITTPGIFKYIPPGFADLGKDTLPRLSAVGELYGCTVPGYNRGMGDPDGYEKAQREWNDVK